ncbi:MAG: hypothetical protein ACLRFK_02190 [Alphaproteobacteria bacterium]
MKKLINKVNFAIVGLMASAVPAMAASSSTDVDSGICKLVGSLGGLLGTLRTLAFIGAGFLIAQWAWEFITKPGEVKLEKFKEKGVGMLVGFVLLFGIGTVISFLMSAAGKAGCIPEFATWNG